MRSRSIALVTLALVGGLAGTAAAQDLSAPRERQGYYVAGGLHAALSYNRDDGKAFGPWGGYGTTIRLGQLITPRLGLGLQIDVASATGEGSTASLTGIGVSGQVEVARNLALHAGLGFGVLSLDKADDDDLQGGYGAAYSLGLTYDWFPTNRRSGGWAVTPGIRVRAVPSDTIDAFAVLAGVELSWWSGLPRNQLALPDAEAYARR